VVKHPLRQMASDALHSSFGNPGFPHLRDALVSEIMEPKPRKRLGRTPARCLWVGPGFQRLFRGFVTGAFCGCLYETAPRRPERLLVTLEVKLAVLAGGEDKVFRRATSKKFGPFSKPYEPCHGFVIQRDRSVTRFGLASLDG
jgi:hypothetical protein